ncbi:MAG: RNA polymerase sporulation sigma factor SigK [Candidatus Borkfalkiaceae bacterium]|nr:RNA polymerase sporulation sigma factor SigK [Christensenellaceae bacterium]
MIFEALRCLLGKILFFCSSVGNDSFPKPLSPAEEADCLRRFRENGDAEAKDKLIRHNLRLVAHIAKKYQGAEDADDLISVGSVGLIKAINTYEPGKGTQLATYTARCIENEILMLLRANKKHRGNLSLSDCVGSDKDGNELTVIDLLAEKEEGVFSRVENSILKEKFLQIMKECLSDREYTVVCLRFGLKGGRPLAQREVAKLLKISRSYISRIEKKGVEKIREAIGNNDFFGD